MEIAPLIHIHERFVILLVNTKIFLRFFFLSTMSRIEKKDGNRKG